MGKRKKTERQQEAMSFSHVYESPKEFQGQWHEQIFKNTAPIVVELGCGHGAYTCALAVQFPEKNFIGIDRKPDRLWHGATTSMESKLENVRFIRTDITHLSLYFAPGEISELWITFPDPYPKNSDARKRMVSGGFLRMYKTLLRPGGSIHLKTDNAALMEFARSEFRGENVREENYCENITDEVLEKYPLLHIQTPFEKKFRARGVPITYVRGVVV